MLSLTLACRYRSGRILDDSLSGQSSMRARQAVDQYGASYMHVSRTTAYREYNLFHAFIKKVSKLKTGSLLPIHRPRFVSLADGTQVEWLKWHALAHTLIP